MITFLLAVALIFVVTLYIHGTKNFNYWKVRGIKHDKPVFLFGTNKNGYLLKQSMTQWATEMYTKYPTEKVVGYFRSRCPGLLIRDPEIIKHILVTDFVYFHVRGFFKDSEAEPLSHNLFSAQGDLWRLLRQRITPAFSSAKLKAMFPLIVERAERLQSKISCDNFKGQILDARELMARYTTDFIGACGFGIDADCLNDEDSAFRKLGMKMFHVTYITAVKGILKEFYPDIFKNFNSMSNYENELIDLVRMILKQKEYTPSNRHDFVDLLLECKQQGKMVGESIQKTKKDGSPELVTLEMDDIMIAAQVFIFFVAGFETSSSATSFTLHQLAFNQKVQTKVQEEVDRVLAKYNNKLCYDAIGEMTYLDWTFKESIRMFPSLGFLSRECAKEYTIPEINVSIDEGTTIIIPVQALHNDPKYFNKPHKFLPERFDPKLTDSIYKNIFLPFGLGPRACIGARLGNMQSLAGLAAVLSRFTVTPAPETLEHPVVDPKSQIVQSIIGGLPLLFQERKNIAQTT